MMNNTNGRIVRRQNDFNNIEAVSARTFPQGVKVGANRTLLCATLAGINGGIASAQIIFGTGLYFGEHKTISFQSNNIHLIATATPISQEYFHSCTTQEFYGIILPQFPALLTKRSLFFFKKKRAPLRQPLAPHS